MYTDSLPPAMYLNLQKNLSLKSMLKLTSTSIVLSSILHKKTIYSSIVATVTTTAVAISLKTNWTKLSITDFDCGTININN